MKCKGRKSKLNGIGPDKDPDSKGPRLTLNYGPKDGTEEGPKMTVEVCHFKARKKSIISLLGTAWPMLLMPHQRNLSYVFKFRFSLSQETRLTSPYRWTGKMTLCPLPLLGQSGRYPHPLDMKKEGQAHRQRKRAHPQLLRNPRVHPQTELNLNQHLHHHRIKTTPRRASLRYFMPVWILPISA